MKFLVVVTPPSIYHIYSTDQLQTYSIDYTLSFTPDLSVLSDSTLTFWKMPHPTVQIPTFHRSAANVFYWLYTIIYIKPVHAIRFYTTIFENAPPHCANPYIPSISCKRILLIIHYHLHHTCQCYQTLHYHYRKCPTPLCKSLHYIDQLQTDSIDYTL